MSDVQDLRTFLVTGGAGFIGSALVRRLLAAGHRVRVLDDESRGRAGRLASVRDHLEFIPGDVRDIEAVERACQGVDGVIHLAAVNGTRHFYEHPDIVLEVGTKGILNVVDAMIKTNVGELFVASSSEVYQEPPSVPTPESVRLVIPDPLNPRYSYAASKMISEMVALHYGLKRLERVVVFRPHNVYGPDMGWDHVIPELSVRMCRLAHEVGGHLVVHIQGAGSETRAFCHIDDFIDGLLRVIEHGQHGTIYNIGTQEETTIRDLVQEIARVIGRDAVIKPGPARRGATPRRCPDIARLRALGYSPAVSLHAGLEPTVRWYDAHMEDAPLSGLG